MIYQLIFGVTLFFRINDKKDTFSVSVFSLSVVYIGMRENESLEVIYCITYKLCLWKTIMLFGVRRSCGLY